MTKDEWIDEARTMLRDFCNSLPCRDCVYGDVNECTSPACNRHGELLDAKSFAAERPTKPVDLPPSV